MMSRNTSAAFGCSNTLLNWANKEVTYFPLSNKEVHWWNTASTNYVTIEPFSWHKWQGQWMKARCWLLDLSWQPIQAFVKTSSRMSVSFPEVFLWQCSAVFEKPKLQTSGKTNSAQASRWPWSDSTCAPIQPSHSLPWLFAPQCLAFSPASRSTYMCFNIVSANLLFQSCSLQMTKPTWCLDFVLPWPFWDSTKFFTPYTTMATREGHRCFVPFQSSTWMKQDFFGQPARFECPISEGQHGVTNNK